MEEQHVNYLRIEQAIRYLEDNFKRQPELEEIAGYLHLSPFHFQRMFTEWAGISPKRFLQFLTIDYLKEKLLQSKNIMEAADSAGLSSQSRVYDLFTSLEAVTPQEYKQKGSGLQIRYAFTTSPFGRCLVGITDRGICWLSFVADSQDERRELESLKAHWFNSMLTEDQEAGDEYIGKIFSSSRSLELPKLHLFVKGTNFQIKVWEALLKIPTGNLTTYQNIAAVINSPKALQAVGSAVGSNHIAYLIPCHRVIRKDGVLGEYRWSSARKKTMIGWEMAKISG